MILVCKVLCLHLLCVVGFELSFLDSEIPGKSFVHGNLCSQQSKQLGMVICIILICIICVFYHMLAKISTCFNCLEQDICGYLLRNKGRACREKVDSIEYLYQVSLAEQIFPELYFNTILSFSFSIRVLNRNYKNENSFGMV